MIMIIIINIFIIIIFTYRISNISQYALSELCSNDS